MSNNIPVRDKTRESKPMDIGFGPQRTPEALGSLFRTERKRRDMTLYQVHATSGLSMRFLSEFERGKPNVSLVKVMQALQAMGLELMIFPRREAGSLMIQHRKHYKPDDQIE